MPVNVTRVLREGAARSIERNGLVLMGVLFVLSAIDALLGAGTARWVNEVTGVSTGLSLSNASDPLVAVPLVFAGLLSLLTGIATVLVTLAAVRVFVSDETRRVPREALTRNGVWAVLNYVVGFVVFGIVVALGFVALVIPGIFLLVTLAFWTVFVAVEDETFLTGFRRSWALTRGHRLRLFLLGVAVVLLTIVVGAVFSLGGLLGGSIGSFLGAVGGAIGGAITTVFSLAALAAAYNQLVALDREDDEFSTDEHASPEDPSTAV